MKPYSKVAQRFEFIVTLLLAVIVVSLHSEHYRLIDLHVIIMRLLFLLLRILTNFRRTNTKIASKENVAGVRVCCVLCVLDFETTSFT